MKELYLRYQANIKHIASKTLSQKNYIITNHKYIPHHQIFIDASRRVLPRGPRYKKLVVQMKHCVFAERTQYEYYLLHYPA